MKRNLKIVCFLFDPKVGGPHVCARNIYSRFREQGHDARIAIPHGPGAAPEFFADSVPLDRLNIYKPTSPRNIIPFLKYAFLLPVSIWRTRKYLKSQKPDAIRVNGVLDLVPVFAGKLAGVPVILYLNDTVFPPRLSRALLRFAKPFSSRIIAAATKVGEHHGLKDGGEVIFEPVDTKKFQPRTPDGFPKVSPVLGLVANWNPIKGQERFIETIRLLRKGGLDARGRMIGLLVPGQKPYWKPLLEQIKTLGLSKYIEHPGFIEDTISEFRNFDILLLTSHSEACPVCVLEAMATGVPVVAFEVGGVAEMLGTHTDNPAGMVVPEGDCRAMAESVREILGDRMLYQNMAANGPKRIEAHFELGTCVRQHETVCYELAGK